MNGLITKKDRLDLIKETFKECSINLGYFGHDKKFKDNAFFLNESINTSTASNVLAKLSEEHNVDFIFSTSGNDRDVCIDAEMGDDNERNILYIGPSKEATKICANKNLTKEVFLRLGIKTPKFILIEDKESLNLLDSLQFPIVRKNLIGWSGFQMEYFDSKKEILQESISYPSLFEEYIRGKEYSLNLCRWKEHISVFPIIDKGNTCRDKHPLNKVRVIPADISHDLEREMINIAKDLANDININGWVDFDFIYEEESKKLHILEINSRFSGSTRLVNLCIEENPYTILLKKALFNSGTVSEEYKAKKIAVELPIPSYLRNLKIKDDERIFYPDPKDSFGILSISAFSMENILVKTKKVLENKIPDVLLEEYIEAINHDKRKMEDLWHFG